jgi:hypothetical protein
MGLINRAGAGVALQSTIYNAMGLISGACCMYVLVPSSVCCWLALSSEVQVRIAIGSTTHNKQAHRNEQVLWAGCT